MKQLKQYMYQIAKYSVFKKCQKIKFKKVKDVIQNDNNQNTVDKYV